MTRLLMLVEGQSEEIFVKQTLAPFLAERGVYTQPIVLWTKRIQTGGGFRGGVVSWGKIRNDLMRLTQDTDAWVTTLLDFYGLPRDFPGYQEALGPGDPHRIVVSLQEKFAAEIDRIRFIPFLALHEFETWVFCSPDVVAEHFNHADLATKLRKAVEKVGGPELINHGENTHPKALLKGFEVGYKETADGPTLMRKIGIPTIRSACPHFANWVGRLEALGQLA